MALTKTQISELYVSIFNRASEKSGSQNWLNSGYNTDATAMANAMLVTDAAKEYFGASLLTDAAFVEHIYKNTLNKGGATVDVAGKAGWVEFLTNHTRGEMVVKMIEAIKEYQVGGAKYATADQATKDAAQQFDNRVKVSDYTADTLATIAVSDINSTLSFGGALIVTANPATVETAKKSVQALTIDGTTFSLTTGVDDLKGTDNADLFKAVNSSAIAEGTLQGGDKIDGGAGNDTLKVDMQKDWTGFTTGSMTNVENVNITSKTATTVNYDASGSTGVSKYVIDSTTGSVTLSQLDALANLEVTGPQADSTFKAAYKATSTVATGTQTDVQNLKVTNVGTINTAAANVASNAKVMTVDIDKVETLAITTAGTANSLDLSTSADVKTVTVTGEGQTEIKDVGVATTSFDASAATGKVIANLANAASNSLTTVKGGSSDDSLTVVADDLTSNAVIAGGSGADKLVIAAGAGKTLQATMTGVETVNVGNVSSALTFSGTNVSDVATINVEGLTTASASFVNMKATPLTVNSIGANTQIVSADSAAAITYNLDVTAAVKAAGTASETSTSAATFANATTATINVGEQVVANGAINVGTAANVTLNVASKVVAATEMTKFTNTITATEATSLNVNATGEISGAANIVAAKATTATLSFGSTAAAALDLDAAKLTTLNVTAGNTLTMAGSDLTKVQNMTVDTTKAFTIGGIALADAANVTVSGTASTSSATFTTLGATNLTHNVNVTATGLKAGLSTTAIDAGTASVNVNVSGMTGAATTTTIDGDSGVTVNAKNLAGALNTGNITTTTGAISVDVSNASSTATVGNLVTNGTTGDVTVLANSIVGNLSVGTMTGNNVTFNAQNALGTVTMSAITAHTSANVTAANLVAANTIAITADPTSTAFTATVNGGNGSETVTVNGGVKQTGITVTGNLGAGTNLVTTTLANSTATAGQTVNLSGLTSSATAGDATAETKTILTAEVDNALTFIGSVKDDEITMGAGSTSVISISDTTLTDSDSLLLGAAASTFTQMSISGIEKMTVAAAGVSLNASAISGDTMTITNTGALTLTGTAGNDVVDLSKITTGATANLLVVDLGAGNDTIVLGAGAQTVKFAANATANGVDTITGFVAGTDKINVDAMTADAVLTAAGAAAIAAGKVYLVTGSATQADSATGAAAAINTTGLPDAAAAGNKAYFVIADDNSSAIYEYTYDGVAAAVGVQASELTLMGTVDKALTATEIVFA